MGALGAFAKGAPIRIISGSATGNADFWFVKGDSPLKTIKDATDSTTIAYSSNGASTHSVVLGLIRELGLKGKPVATGGPAATLTVALSGQVDIGWTSPPLGFDMLDDGRIRIFARANDVPSLKGQTIRVNIANANSLKAKRDVFVRFVKAFGETIDWMYSVGSEGAGGLCRLPQDDAAQRHPPARRVLCQVGARSEHREGHGWADDRGGESQIHAARADARRNSPNSCRCR